MIRFHKLSNFFPHKQRIFSLKNAAQVIYFPRYRKYFLSTLFVGFIFHSIALCVIFFPVFFLGLNNFVFYTNMVMSSYIRVSGKLQKYPISCNRERREGHSRPQSSAFFLAGGAFVFVPRRILLDRASGVVFKSLSVNFNQW